MINRKYFHRTTLSFITLIFAFLHLNFLQSQESPLNIIVIGAHPDDADLCAGGTAILWAERGHHVKFLSLTNGDAGHQNMGGGALAKRRRGEAAEVAKVLGIAEYEVLDNHDGELEASLAVRLQVIRQIRQWKADVVILPRPNDYHPDHRNTGIVVQDAAYMVIVPNVASDTPPLRKNPVFLYCQDRFEKPNPFSPDIAIDIDAVYKRKIDGLSEHVSQFFEWLPWTSNALEQVPSKAEERIKWLGAVWQRPVSESVKNSLGKWYGNEHASTVGNAEAFEICEYGTQPSDNDIKRIFPMLDGRRYLVSTEIEGAITIDGSLTENEYSEIPKIEILNNLTGKSIEEDGYQTSFQVFNDRDNLYVSFSCDDKDIYSSFTKRDQHLWEEEAVEVFIDTDENPNTYFEIEISPANVLFDSYIVDPLNIDLVETPKFDFRNIRHGVQVEGSLNNRTDIDKKWTVEISIPLSELIEPGGSKPLDVREWKINFYRINTDGAKVHLMAWRPTYGRFHRPEKFGILRIN